MKQVMWVAAAVAALFSLVVIASTPDVLVFTDGTRMDVEHFELRGTIVVFATEDGKLHSVPASLVDRAATAEANGISYLGLPTAVAAAPPPPTTPTLVAQNGEGTISVADGGSPAVGVDIFLFANQGKQPLGTTNNVGQLPFDPALLTGKVRVTVAVRKCPEGVEVYLVSVETDDACREVEDASDETDCSCEVAGPIWWGSSISVDVTTLIAEGAGSSILSNPLFWAGTGGAASAVVVIAATGGDDDTATSLPPSTFIAPTPAPVPTATPAPIGSQTDLPGMYGCNLSVINNPSNHPNLLGDRITIEVRQEGNNSSVFSNDQNFIDVAGPFIDNRQNLVGNGNYAGFATTAEWMGNFQSRYGRSRRHTGRVRRGDESGASRGRRDQVELQLLEMSGGR